MRRREFMTLLGGAAAFGSRLARAQQPAMPVIGLLSGTNREPRLIDAIWKGLNEAGFTDGKNATMEFRFAEGHFERLPAMATELVERNVAAIIAIQSVAAPLAAKAATSTIPIVFSIGGDPVKLGLVASLSRPGGNVTGATFLVNTLSAKRLELARELCAVRQDDRPAGQSEKSGSAFGDRRRAGGGARARASSSMSATPAAEQEIDAAFAHFADAEVGAVTFAADATFNAGRRGSSRWPRSTACRRCISIASSPRSAALMSYGGFDTDAYRAGRSLCRTHPQGREARRPAGAAGHQGRARHQSEDRQGTRHRRAAVAARPRRRRHPIGRGWLR